MISLLYFKPGKRSAGGDLMISFVMEKCLILPVCVRMCVSAIRIQKSSVFYERLLSLDSFNEHMQGGK